VVEERLSGLPAMLRMTFSQASSCPLRHWGLSVKPSPYIWSRETVCPFGHESLHVVMRI
jgi:hypothetical protein